MTQFLDKGTLFVVALPIGNPQDITLRAIDILKSVDIIAAEDTRVTRDLLKNYQIYDKTIYSYHNHNEKESSLGIIQELKSRKSVALVSDAGTPRVSDPGFRLVTDAYSQNIPVVCIPGASSLTAALSISPIGGTSHYFGGFASNNSQERKAEFEKVRGLAHQIIYFESPHRLLEHLQDAELYFTETAVFRELTKTHQEVVFHTTNEVKNHYEKFTPKGEVIVIHRAESKTSFNLQQTESEITRLLQEGLSSQDVLDKLQSITVLNRKELYKKIQELKHNLK